MRWYRNLKLSAKLIALTVVVTLFAVLVGLGGVAGIRSVAASATAMYEDVAVPLADLGAMSGDLRAVPASLRDAVIAGTPTGVADARANVGRLRKHLDGRQASFERHILRADLRAAFREYLADRTEVESLQDSVLALSARRGRRRQRPSGGWSISWRRASGRRRTPRRRAGFFVVS
jgi:Four helix bundle sensory module for signal transduction